MFKKIGFNIWFLCFGYFASYVPYSLLTKMITSGSFEGMNGKGFTGFQIQAVAILASVVSTFSFITLAGWWKYTTHFKIFNLSLPKPQWFTLISGICTAGQIITTTLSYTFSGVSIVFAMLLMRGGVLVMAPMVDLLAKRKRKIYWPSWVASGLSIGALLVAFFGKAGTAMTLICAIDISIYLFVYFFRLLFMSNRAKSNDENEKKRYFAEEQLTANTVLFSSLFIVGLIGSTMAVDSIPGQIWFGFSKFPFSGYFFHVFILGVFSYGTGLFGGLIFLDKRENTFTVPANRVASVIAGVISTYLLAIFWGQRYPGKDELVGIGIVIFAIVFLAYRSVVERKSKACSLIIDNKCDITKSKK